MVNPWPEIQAFASREKLFVIGVDEAGRGPLFGPVVAGAALLQSPDSPVGLACSKTLSETKREALFEQIKSQAVAWGIAQASVEEIDRLNILQASLLAMHRAVDKVISNAGIPEKSCLVLVDGNKLPKWSYHAKTVIKGDVYIPAISAGSILAKVYRDRWCREIALDFPDWAFDEHMGYPTAKHLEILKRLGPTNHHRKSFKPVREILLESQRSLF